MLVAWEIAGAIKFGSTGYVDSDLSLAAFVYLS